MDKPLALITGVGPGSGSAMVRRFVRGGYRVAMIARNGDRLRDLEREMADCRGYVCDVAEPPAFLHVLQTVTREMGPARVAIHNAVSGAMGTFLEVRPSSLERTFRVNLLALLHLAQHVAPAMIAAGEGALLATGNTAAQRGRANFAAFAPTKAAARILMESIARELGPKGVHAAYLLIDGIIDHDWTRALRPDAADGDFVRPDAIAEEAWRIVQQDSSAWSFLVEIRPFGERW